MDRLDSSPRHHIRHGRRRPGAVLKLTLTTDTDIDTTDQACPDLSTRRIQSLISSRRNDTSTRKSFQGERGGAQGSGAQTRGSFAARAGSTGAVSGPLEMWKVLKCHLIG